MIGRRSAVFLVELVSHARDAIARQQTHPVASLKHFTVGLLVDSAQFTVVEAYRNFQTVSDGDAIFDSVAGDGAGDAANLSGYERTLARTDRTACEPVFGACAARTQPTGLSTVRADLRGPDALHDAQLHDHLLRLGRHAAAVRLRLRRRTAHARACAHAGAYAAL